MNEKYHLEEEEDSWLLKMHRLRGHWVNAYLKDVFSAGMTTSQRSRVLIPSLMVLLMQTRN